jgi:3-deoxy-D-arabino-heptulosonate 7-phosphate (DAHP) synthase
VHPIIIAGPCAAESEAQIDIAIAEASKRKVDFLRVNLWKPRTKPGFDGLGEKGFPLLERVAKAGLNPGLEVIMPEQATQVMDTVLPHLQPGGKLLLWIGARNQNHIVQREIARVVAQDSRVMLMVKNQPWRNEDHWEGIIEHVLGTGLQKENLLNCHRGFAPHDDNPLGLRNVPDFAMCERIKQKTGIPIIFDPSHTGGSVPNVFKMGEAAAAHNIDGIVVEVHHDPANALTDQKQQITWPEFDKLVRTMHMETA